MDKTLGALYCKQTVFLRKKESDGLQNLLRITVENCSCKDATLFLDDVCIWQGTICEKLQLDHWIDEPLLPQTMTIKLLSQSSCITESFDVKPVKHLEIHMVHSSHHDPGYTDLLSHVFENHYDWIDHVLEDMEAREHYPEDTRLRISIEEFWSLDYYLSHAPKERVQKVIDRVKRGDIEITALYGNMISEQLGHEECYRLLSAAKAFTDRCGVELTSASHNDVPDISWGMCRVLSDCGIKILCADFPRYYDWGFSGLVSFWDSKAAYGYEGAGACYWNSPDGKKLLLWNSDDIKAEYWDADQIEQLSEHFNGVEYPFDVFRMTVKAGNMDNAAYVTDYTDRAKQWNETYAYPHIVSSTNELFRQALLASAQKNQVVIPDLKGEMPGQDYPLGAMSMAQITSTARRTQNKTVAAEKLLALTSQDALVKDQSKRLSQTWKDLLMSDDHAYGYQFPAGPAMRASYWEKGTYAMRAQATAHDLMDKAMASVADRIAPVADVPFKLVVFNPCAQSGDRAVEAPMREFDNCGTIMTPGNDNPDFRKGYLLNNRRRVNPDARYWQDGLFDLVDLQTGQRIDYDIETLNWDDPRYDAPESCGLGSGTDRYGFFEHPGGMKRVLRFVAKDLPSFGYRCYGLMPKDKTSALSAPKKASFVENGIYRMSVDEGGICSLIDLRNGCELLDHTCAHRLGQLVVRDGRSGAPRAMHIIKSEVVQNDLCGEVKLYGQLDGAHDVCVRFVLWKGIDRIDAGVRLLKNAKPLQSVFVAFPFVGKGFRYQGVLCELEPVKDSVPGAQSDFLTVKDYIRIKDSNLMWSSKDTAVVSLGALHQGYLSPAHSCIMENETHLPLKESDFENGTIYAMLSTNNFGTNFMCSQVFDSVYQFSFGVAQQVDDLSCALWGEREQNPVVTQFTDRSRGTLPFAASMLETKGLQCISLRSLGNNMYLARLWNHSDMPQNINLIVNGQTVSDFVLCDGFGEELPQAQICQVAPKAVATIRFLV